jgi:DNA modification methylase
MINGLYNENCLITMYTMDSDTIDLTVCSPPYDKIRFYKGYEFNFEKIASELYRVTKPGGVVVWVIADQVVNGSETGSSFRQALHFLDCGFNLHDTMIYGKMNPSPNAQKRYQQCFEYMFVFSKGIPKTVNLITRKRRNKCNDPRTFRHRAFSRQEDGEFTRHDHEFDPNEEVPIENIWFYWVGGGNTTKDDIAFQHPAIFPDQLAEDHILTWSNEGDLVYDPFTGSGTTLKAAKKLNRKWIGSEVSKEYCDIALKRLEIIEDEIAFE